MSLDTATYKSGQDFGRAEDGMYPARLVQVVEMGMQEQFDWQTQESKGYKPRVMLTFELPTERLVFDNGDDRPRWYSKEYTLSNHAMASITQVVKALDSSGSITNLALLVGSSCMVEIGTTSTGKPKITKVVSIVKGMQVPELENPTTVFDLDSPDLERFKTFPQWIKDKIREGKNFADSKLDLMISTADNFDDDIPF